MLGPLLRSAKKIKELSFEYYLYLENLKKEMMARCVDPERFYWRIMDKPIYLDQIYIRDTNLIHLYIYELVDRTQIAVFISWTSRCRVVLYKWESRCCNP